MPIKKLNSEPLQTLVVEKTATSTKTSTIAKILFGLAFLTTLSLAIINISDPSNLAQINGSGSSGSGSGSSGSGSGSSGSGSGSSTNCSCTECPNPNPAGDGGSYSYQYESGDTYIEDLDMWGWGGDCEYDEVCSVFQDIMVQNGNEFTSCVCEQISVICHGPVGSGSGL
jgi:hypothetical protein